jgi:hypothetical protein
MPFIPKDERPALARLAGLRNEQASELSGALSAASDELDGDELVFLNDIAEGMGRIEEDELRLDETKQEHLRERLTALTESPAMEIHAKARSLQQDRENTYCRARIITETCS